MGPVPDAMQVGEKPVVGAGSAVDENRDRAALSLRLHRVAILVRVVWESIPQSGSSGAETQVARHAAEVLFADDPAGIDERPGFGLGEGDLLT